MDKKTRFRFFGFEYLARHVQILIGLIVLFVVNFIFYLVASISCFIYYNDGKNETASALSNYLVHTISHMLPYEITIVSGLIFAGIIACIIYGISRKK